MLSLGVEDIAVLAVVWLICGFVSAIVFIRWAVLRWAGKAVVNALVEPTEDTRLAINALLTEILHAEIKTGRTVKDEDGKERPEVLSFVRFVGREIWHYLGMLRKSSTGGKTTQAMAEMDPLGMAMPRRGQSTTEFIGEQMMMRLAPRLDEIITKKIEEVINSGRQL